MDNMDQKKESSNYEKINLQQKDYNTSYIVSIVFHQNAMFLRAN